MLYLIDIIGAICYIIVFVFVPGGSLRLLLFFSRIAINGSRCRLVSFNTLATTVS